jgi:hypothetical protein
MALVALSSRLTHALRNMTKSAESLAPRKKGGYGHRGMSEYKRLWMEYTERFRIDFTANADRIAFIEAMREVRNQIVHEGAEAQTYEFQEDVDWNDGVLAFMDYSFSKNSLSTSQTKMLQCPKNNRTTDRSGHSGGQPRRMVGEGTESTRTLSHHKQETMSREWIYQSTSVHS